MADPTDAPADPLVLAVGVTGHRNPHPQALPSLRIQVVRAFERLEQELGLRLVVLSSLAEGADRLVAEIALERGHALVAPLPLPAEEYEKDFADDASRAEFRKLLARTESHFTVPLPSGDDVTVRAARDAAYRRAGILVARDCHLLLALWDGQGTGKPGGTWDIVRIKRTGDEGIMAAARPDRPEVQRGIVVHIHTPRVGAASPDEVTTRWPGEKEPGWRRLQAVCALTRRFNGDAAELRSRAPDSIARSSTSLHTGQLPAGCPPALDGLARLFAMADALAGENQSRVRHAWRLLYGLGLLAVVVFGLYAHGTHNHWLALAGYLATLGGAWLMYRRFETSERHSRFLDYRALAEALRVLFFWRAASLPGDPFVGYSANLAAEVEWVRQALRVEAARVAHADGAGETSAARIEFVVKDWVLPQREFYRTAKQRDVRRLKTIHRWGFGTIVAGVILAVVVLLLNIVDHHELVESHKLAHEWTLILMPLLPAIGASLFSFAHRMGWEAQERQYERIATLFEPAVDALQSGTADPALRQELVTQLAREALAEHAQWVLLHRQRPFEFIAGGG